MGHGAPSSLLGVDLPASRFSFIKLGMRGVAAAAVVVTGILFSILFPRHICFLKI